MVAPCAGSQKAAGGTYQLSGINHDKEQALTDIRSVREVAVAGQPRTLRG